MESDQGKALDDWSKLPDKPGVYPLGHIYYALRQDPYVNRETVYGTGMKKSIATYLKAHHAFTDHPSEENQNIIRQAWKDVVDALNMTLFLIPFRYDDDLPDTEDRAIHLTAAAADAITKDSILLRCGQMTGMEMFPLNWVCGENGRITPDPTWWDITRISGSEGFRFSDGNDRSHGLMRFFTRGGGGYTFLGIYTDISYVLDGFDNQPCPHIALISVADVLNYVRHSPDLYGILINPDTETHCAISRQQLGIQ